MYVYLHVYVFMKIETVSQDLLSTVKALLEKNREKDTALKCKKKCNSCKEKMKIRIELFVFH